MRKFITVIFLLLVSIGIKSYASPVKIIPVETTGLSMVFTVSENKKVIYGGLFNFGTEVTQIHKYPML